MAVSTVQNPTTGVTPTAYENALQLFGGEILAEFENKNILMALTRVKDMVPGAKSVSFPALGAIGTSYHTAGDNILTDNDATAAAYLKSINQGEQVIWADREALAPIFLDKGMERISHWQDRAEYSKKMGHALARQADQMILRKICLTANTAASAVYTGSPSGYTPAAFAMSAASIIDYLLDAQLTMDNNDVPDEDRHVFIRPTEMRLLVDSTEGKAYIDKDYEDANGSLKRSVIGMIAGFHLHKITHMPTDNYAGTGNQLIAGTEGNSYVFDARKLRMVAFQMEGVGTAKAADISLESEYKIELRGDLLVAGYTMGHGSLRPECCSYALST